MAFEHTICDYENETPLDVSDINLTVLMAICIFADEYTDADYTGYIMDCIDISSSWADFYEDRRWTRDEAHNILLRVGNIASLDNCLSSTLVPGRSSMDSDITLNLERSDLSLISRLCKVVDRHLFTDSRLIHWFKAEILEWYMEEWM